MTSRLLPLLALLQATPRSPVKDCDAGGEWAEGSLEDDTTDCSPAEMIA